MLSDSSLFGRDARERNVLILVLMEYALWQMRWIRLSDSPPWVLILVLMEYALWPWKEMSSFLRETSLNPCSNGICSLTENAAFDSTPEFRVLILVLMEYALWHNKKVFYKRKKHSLNPCSNGICSLTQACKRKSRPRLPVLILVLMEYALWRQLL